MPYSDLDVLNLRQCFREFSLEAYPALVALVWPEYQRPQVNRMRFRAYPIRAILLAILDWAVLAKTR